MDKPFNLNAIIEKWQVDYCEWVPAKRSGCLYPQVPFNQRKELLTILVQQVKLAGKPRDFFTNSRRDEVVAEIIPRGKHLPKSTIDGFRNATKKMLNWVIEEVYPDEENPKIEIKESIIETSKPITKKHNKSNYKNINEPPVLDVLDEEMAELLGLNGKK